MNQAVIVFEFPNPENQIKLGLIIEKARESFKDMPDVKAYLAVNQTAERVIAVVKGEFDEKLMRRAIPSTKLKVVLPQEESEQDGDTTESGV